MYRQMELQNDHRASPIPGLGSKKLRRGGYMINNNWDWLKKKKRKEKDCKKTQCMFVIKIMKEKRNIQVEMFLICFIILFDTQQTKSENKQCPIILIYYVEFRFDTRTKILTTYWGADSLLSSNWNNKPSLLTTSKCSIMFGYKQKLKRIWIEFSTYGVSQYMCPYAKK